MWWLLQCCLVSECDTNKQGQHWVTKGHLLELDRVASLQYTLHGCGRPCPDSAFRLAGDIRSYHQLTFCPVRQVAFDGHSAEECRECWAGIQARLRLHRTLGDLLDDAQAFRWNIARVRQNLRVRTAPMDRYP